ncbi:hypothetical protein D3C85_1613880 [compost metagenome]
MNQAVLKLDRGKAQIAIDMLDKVLPLYADKPQNVLTYRAAAAIDLGQLDLAERDFATVRAHAASDAEVLNGLCWTAALKGVLLDQALKDCDAALAVSPNTPHILDSRARVLLQMGDATAALTV